MVCLFYSQWPCELWLIDWSDAPGIAQCCLRKMHPISFPRASGEGELTFTLCTCGTFQHPKGDTRDGFRRKAQFQLEPQTNSTLQYPSEALTNSHNLSNCSCTTEYCKNVPFHRFPSDLDLSQKLSSKCKMHSPPPSNVVTNVILLSLLPLAARASLNKLWAEIRVGPFLCDINSTWRQLQ